MTAPADPEDTTANNASPAVTDDAFVSVATPLKTFFVVLEVFGRLNVPVPINVPVALPGVLDRGNVPAAIFLICTTSEVVELVEISPIVIEILVTVPVKFATAHGVDVVPNVNIRRTLICTITRCICG